MESFLDLLGLGATVSIIIILGIKLIILIVAVYLINLTVNFLITSTEKNKAIKRLADLQCAEIEYKKTRLYSLEENYMKNGSAAFTKINEYIESKKYVPHSDER